MLRKTIAQGEVSGVCSLHLVTTRLAQSVWVCPVGFHRYYRLYELLATQSFGGSSSSSSQQQQHAVSRSLSCHHICCFHPIPLRLCRMPYGPDCPDLPAQHHPQDELEGVEAAAEQLWLAVPPHSYGEAVQQEFPMYLKLPCGGLERPVALCVCSGTTTLSTTTGAGLQQRIC